jgi:HD-GYP domain-containing protein (c-di-GMP phosphodiesterase class II)
VESLENKVTRHGRPLINSLYILQRITGIYDSMNEAILNAGKRAVAEMEPLLEEHGELTIKIIAGSFYLEGTRIKAGVSDIESFISLAEELMKKSIGVLDFRSPLTAEDLINLAYAIKGASDSSHVQSALEDKKTLGIMVGGPVVLQKEELIDLGDSRALARRAYLKALSVMKEIEENMKTGSRSKIKKIKRAIQLMIDSILTDESFILRFSMTKSYENYHYYHPVNVAILSVALGKKIGMNRLELRNLAMTALLHDAGKVEIPASVLNKKTELTPKEMDLLERHPVEGTKVILRTFGLNETSILSMFVNFEHHMKSDLSGYPRITGSRSLNIFSRIVSIADDYDSMTSGKVYGRMKLSHGEAIKRLLSGSGRLYEPSIVRAFTAIFA